jgi:hypothetical protein
MNVNHTPKAKTTKGVRLSKGVKEQKKGPKGPGEARARFLTKDSTWPTTNHSTLVLSESSNIKSSLTDHYIISPPLHLDYIVGSHEPSKLETFFGSSCAHHLLD